MPDDAKVKIYTTWELNLLNAAVAYCRAFERSGGQLLDPMLVRRRRRMLQMYDQYEDGKRREKER